MPGFAIINADDVVGGVPVDGATMIYRSAATFEGATTPSHAAALSVISPLFTPNLYINDTFDYPNGTVLSSLPDYEEVFATEADNATRVKAFGGEVYLNTYNNRYHGVRFNKPLPVNHFCEVDVTSTAVPIFTYFMQVRLVSGTTFYAARVTGGGTALGVTLRKVINGVESIISLSPSTPFNLSLGTWRLEAEGTSPTTLRIYKDGVLQASATDTSPELVTGGAGFRLGSKEDQNSLKLSRFQCGAI